LEKDRYIGFKATDFVLDQDFIAWTDGFERDTEPAWQEWLEQHPIEAIEVEKARQILMSLHFSQKEFIAEEVDQEWQ
jgi:hypothetical protein